MNWANTSDKKHDYAEEKGQILTKTSSKTHKNTSLKKSTDFIKMQQNKQFNRNLPDNRA